MALPFPHLRFDVAVMALVIFYVPEPTKAVNEGSPDDLFKIVR
jgi:hypothetical protein